MSDIDTDLITNNIYTEIAKDVAISNKLIRGKAELLTVEPSSDHYRAVCALTEQEAMSLITNLIKVFQIPNSNIEVIHFPIGVSKAQCLRNAADLLDKAGEGEVSCPPVWEEEPTNG